MTVIQVNVQQSHGEPNGTAPVEMDKLDLIERTRQSIKFLSETERFLKAKYHIEDAMRYKHPSPENAQTQKSFAFKYVNAFHGSVFWESLLRILCFFYMYDIVLQNFDNGRVLFFISSPMLSAFLLEVILEIYLSSFDNMRKTSKFAALFYFKIAVLALLMADEVLQGCNVNLRGRPVRPFKVFRAMLPILYDSQIRRSFQSLLSAYKDMLVYFLFYVIVMLAFAIVGTVFIHMPESAKQKADYDPILNNYQELSRMIFITYITGTHDSYPNNQLPAIQANIYYYGFFIGFIFLNMFLFTSIPGSLLFDCFRETRSKIILIDEVKMQHSLMVAFISLGQTNFIIDIKQMIKFLHYLYGNRVRYIDSVTQICLKLNTNDHCEIVLFILTQHINEFMQLGRILQQNSSLKPPYFSDWPRWIQFRKIMNEIFNIKAIQNSLLYNAFTAFLCLLAFANSINYLKARTQINSVFDTCFTYLFVFELLFKVIAIGPQNFINEKWSFVDTFLVVTGLLSEIFQKQLFYKDALFRTFRIYRAAYLIKILFQNSFIRLELQIYKKTRNLAGNIMIIFPLILRFLPLFFIVYYVLGILGEELFYDIARLEPTAAYSGYDQFSHFKDFINTQFVFVQIMTEAGWSSIMVDYASRDPNAFYCVMVFFVCCHMIIVLIMTSLMKSIFWSIFFTVNEQLEERKKIQKLEMSKYEKTKLKVQELDILDKTIESIGNLATDTIIKRQIFQSKGNNDILMKIRAINKKKRMARPSIKHADKGIFRSFLAHKEILEDEFESQQRLQEENQQYIFAVLERFTREKFSAKNFNDIQEIQEEDFEEKIQKLIDKLKCRNASYYTQIIKNEILLKHLTKKLVLPYSQDKKLKSQDSNQFNVDQLSSKQNLTSHIFTLHFLLNMVTSRRQQKAVVIQSLIENKVINSIAGRDLLTKKMSMKSFNIDESCTIRRMYMSDTNKNLIDKFEAQYFADIYGQAFKQINRVTIQPLIKLQAKLIYSMKNILRYPQIQTKEFFNILAIIEDEASNKLLKKGSLFKFVFQLNADKNIWFSIYYNHSGEVKLHFIKHGIWLYDEQLVENEIHYGRDIFKFQPDFNHGSLLDRTNMMKSLFTTFESLAFSLHNKESFFESSPLYHIYDLYTNYVDVSTVQRFIQKDLQISKIMFVVLAKEDQRQTDNQIPYQLSEITISPPVDEINFQVDQTQKETLQKLNRLSSLNDEQITANEGLPFAYVMNFMCQMQDILRLYSPNFIHQVQKALNGQFEKDRQPSKQ